MKDSILCCALCVGLGMAIGGVIVSNNAKVRKMIIDAQTKATETYETVKSELEQKQEDKRKS